ncbi:MAG TPA: exodeoxyribonuclease VII small subunit [Candidatus Sulfotelmatobacter sp.]|nr:exodeoxyribonuclease VII small subunit [Candidatus Sulfotelmatobacter sp.]
MSAPDPAKVAFDDLLEDLEKAIARLAEGTAPLEELVSTHQRALGLLGDAQARMEDLKAGAERITRSLAE